MNRLFTEGLLDQEYFTQTHDQRKAVPGSAGAFGLSASWLDIPDKTYGANTEYRTDDQPIQLQKNLARA